MEITFTQEQGRLPVTVIELNGLLNMGTAPQLEKEARLAHAAGARHLLIDLGGVSSLTSAGLRTIMMICNLFSEGHAGQKTPHPYVKLLSPNPPIRQILTIAGFDHFLEIFEDRKTAVEAF